MLILSSRFLAVAAVIAMAAGVSSVRAEDARMWHKLHPGTTNPTANGYAPRMYSNAPPAVVRSYSYEPAASTQAARPAPAQAPSNQIVRSYSYEPSSRPAATLTPAPAPRVVRRYSYEPQAVAPQTYYAPSRARSGHRSYMEYKTNPTARFSW